MPLPEIMAAAERRFEAAAHTRDADAMVGVILELETAIGQWEADMDEDQGTEQARALLRSLVGRLGRVAQDGLTDPRDRLRPAVEPLLELRASVARGGQFRRRRRHQGGADRGRVRRQRHPGGHSLAADRDGLIGERLTWTY